MPARWLGWIDRLQFPAALALLVACWIAPGWLAAAAALPWIAITVLMALTGLWRIRHEGVRRELDGLCRDSALVFAVIGGAWTMADRSGYRPLGFDASIVALTAVHFHYAAFVLPVVTGLAAQRVPGWNGRIGSIGVVAG